MTRQALAAASLVVFAVFTFGAGTWLLAGRDSSKAIYTCGTVPGTIKRAEGRMNTWNLSALSFRPDSRSTKPLLIRYKSITRLEYGRTPPHRLETSEVPPITLACALKRQDYYLTIFYEEIPLDEDENKDTSQSKDQKDKDRQDQKEKGWREQRDQERQEQKDKERPDLKARKDRAERRDRTDPANRSDQKDQQDQKDRKDLKKEKEYFAVFELGDGVLRQTLRILETRSGKRIKYQDAEARKAAR